MFQLNKIELEHLRCQNVTSNHGGLRYLPYAFTEQGVSMLSALLRSNKAIDTSIRIINTFVAMRRIINSNLFLRMDNFETKLIEHDQKLKELFIKLSNQEPIRGIFYNSQVFDAYKFVSDLIRKAKESIILIDNYVDDSVLTLFAKRKNKVDVTIFTKTISKILEQDLKKFNSQYQPISIKPFNNSHDRFLIIDKNIYHFGASLKDIGKKWFAFSRFNKGAIDMLTKLRTSIPE